MILSGSEARLLAGSLMRCVWEDSNVTGHRIWELLSKKNVQNNILHVMVGNRDGLMKSVIGLAYNVSLVPHVHELQNVWDTVEVEEILPAMPPTVGKIQESIRSAYMKRAYRFVERTGGMKITQEIVDKVNQLLLNPILRHPDDRNGRGIEDEFTQSHEEAVNDTLKMLEAKLAKPAASARHAIELGMRDEGEVNLLYTCTDMALASTLTDLTSMITSDGDGAKVRKRVAEKYVARYSQNVNALTRNPVHFLYSLIDEGKRSIQLVGKLPGEHAVVHQSSDDPNSMSTLPVSGIILLTRKAYKGLQELPSTFIKQGRLSMTRRTFLKPVDQGLMSTNTCEVKTFYGDDDDKHTAIPYNGNGDYLVKASDKTASRKRKREPTEVEASMITLTDVGDKLLAAVPSPDDEVDNRRRISLNHISSETQCLYMVDSSTTNLTAVVLASTNEVKNVSSADPYGRTSCLTPTQTVLMTAPLGLLKSKDSEEWTTWTKHCEREQKGNDHLTDQVGEVSIAAKVPRARIYLPGSTSFDCGDDYVARGHTRQRISNVGGTGQALDAGSECMVAAFADPLIYHPAPASLAMTETARKLLKGMHGSSAEVNRLGGMMEMKIKICEKRKELIDEAPDAFRPESSVSLSMLREVETFPLHDLEYSAATEEFTYKRRRYFHQIPLEDRASLLQRAILLLARMGQETCKTLETSITNLKKEVMDTEAGNVLSLKSLLDISKKLAENVKRHLPGWDKSPICWRCTRPGITSELCEEFIVGKEGKAEDDLLMAALVLLPVITGGKLQVSISGKSTTVPKEAINSGLGSSIAFVPSTALAVQWKEALEKNFIDYLGDEDLFNVTSSMKLHAVIKDTEFSDIVKIACLIVQMQDTSFETMKENITHGFSTGFSFELVNAETSYCEKAVYSRLGSYEMLAMPKNGLKVTDHAGVFGNMTTAMFIGGNGIDTHAVGSSFVAHNESLQIAMTKDRSPLLCFDHIEDVSDLENSSDPDLKAIGDFIRSYVERNPECGEEVSGSGSMVRGGQDPPRPKFISLIKNLNTSGPTAECAEYDVLGNGSGLGGGGYNGGVDVMGASRIDRGWADFYTQPTQTVTNTYAALFGSLYFSRYTPQHVKPDPENACTVYIKAVGIPDSYIGGNSLRGGGSVGCGPSDTTLTLQYLYDLNNRDAFTAQERQVMEKTCDPYNNVECKLNAIVSPGVTCENDREGRHRTVLRQNFAPPTKMGKAIPYSLVADTKPRSKNIPPTTTDFTRPSTTCYTVCGPF